ncbi:TetR-like C-terminal domain-containing protein [Pseudonocardia charpentierae]
MWALLHGLASLEITGNFTSVGVDPGPLYADAVRSGPAGTEIP